jgi:hypothetical protein
LKTKRLIVGFLLLVLVSLSSSFISNKTLNQVANVIANKDENLGFDLSCTIFTVTIGNKVFYGSSEDAPFMPGSYFWFSTTGYDTIYFGYDNNDHPWDGYPMGAMNEKGVTIDMNSLPAAGLIPENGKQSIGAIVENIMQTCATVNEVVSWCKAHNFGSSMSWQAHFGDASGDAVVVSAGEDRKVAYTRIGDSNYLVSTNWNLANQYNYLSYPCYRYDKATEMLDAIDNEENLTIQSCTDVLAAVATGPSYCYIADLTNRDLYLFYPYHFRFDIHVKLNLHVLLANNPQKTLISSLFPEVTPPPPPNTVTVPDTAGFWGYSSIFLVTGCILMIYIKRKRNKH